LLVNQLPAIETAFTAYSFVAFVELTRMWLVVPA
jgi:hypothetical protein